MGYDENFRKTENVTVAEARGGLSNRLKCLISSMRIADKTSSSLIVYWPLESTCNCKFSDLFENEIVEIDSEDFEIIVNIKDKDKKYRIINTWRLELLPEDKLPKNSSRNLPYCPERYIDMQYDRIPIAIRKDFLKYINKLRPIKNITEQVDGFSKKFNNDTVGISIRSWPGEIDFERTKLFDLRNVYKIMDKLKSSTIFISCDSEEVLKKIKDRYGEKVLTYPLQTFAGDRNTADGIQDALVESLLLSKCKELKVSYLSTYGEVAWWFGGCKANVEVIPPKTYFFKIINLGYKYIGFCFFRRWYFCVGETTSVSSIVQSIAQNKLEKYLLRKC